MIVGFTEVYEINTGTTSLREQKRQFSLREIYINPDHVVCLRPDPNTKVQLDEGFLPERLRKEHSFTKIHLDRGHAGIDVVVVGSPSAVEDRLRGPANKELLKG